MPRVLATFVNRTRTALIVACAMIITFHTALACFNVAAAEPAVIVALGDSITKGVRDGVASRETFAAVLEHELRGRGMTTRVINVGVGGERTDQALLRLDDAVLVHAPKIVTVMYGTNDSYVDPGKTDSRLSPDEYARNLEELVERLRGAGAVPVLMTPPRWAKSAKLNGLGEHPNVRLNQFVDACRGVARRTETPLVDHFAHWTEREQAGVDLSTWTTDACHPDPQGHREIATTMLPVIAAVLGEQPCVAR